MNDGARQPPLPASVTPHATVSGWQSVVESRQ
jgi:hypothetical protein